MKKPSKDIYPKAPTIPLLLATGFGTGYSPVAPGTAGSLLAWLIWAVLPLFLPAGTVPWVTAALVLLSTAAGVWSATILERYWGKDPQRINIDEMAGTWLCLLALPSGTIWGGLAAVVLFRILDIWKPLNIRKMEKLERGWGIMMDDILAGLYGFLLLILLRAVL